MLQPAFPLLLLILTSMPGSCVPGSDLLAAETPVERAIDHYIDQQNGDRGRSASELADDVTILRRTTLDLAGRIPTIPEREWFLQQPVEERRERLIQRLLSLPDSSDHLRDALDELLLPNQPYSGEFRDYLAWAIAERRPWDQMFRDMLLPEAGEPPRSGAAQFLRSRARQLDDLTNDTAVLFFGVNVSCAKCHDHPLVDDWKQDHYFGMQAFFNRTFLSKKNVVLEKPFGSVSFQTTDGTEKAASLMFLDGTQVRDATPEYSDEQRKELEEQIRKLERDDDPDVQLALEFSPREQLVAIALADESEQFFARNIVNRTWQRLMGTAIVDPPDQMHSGNSPSHPELLQWLTRDLVTHQYDLWRLIRGIVASDAYARDTVWPSQDEPPPRQAFAVGMVRPLTPRQLALSLLVAVRNPQRWPAIDDSEATSGMMRDLRSHSDGWSREFEPPGESFQVTVDEALFFSNSDRVQNELLQDSDDRLMGHLQQLTDDAQVVCSVWEAILSREPTTMERDAAIAWLQRADTVRETAIRDLVWATLANAEMRFNY